MYTHCYSHRLNLSICGSCSVQHFSVYVMLWNKSLFSSFYLEDLTNPLALDGELELWEKYWKTKNTCLPDNISSTLKSINFPDFENIKMLLRILATLPVTSCECERSFSALRRLKNYNRSTMVAAGGLRAHNNNNKQYRE